MGGLTSNRKRGGDSLTSSRYTASPNYYIPFKIDTPLDLHLSKKQKVSSMHLNPDSRVSSPSISSHQSTFSRIRQYPDPVKPLKSVHAPCRNSKFFSARMGGLFSKLEQARAAAVSSFRYVNVDKSEKAVEVDLEKAVEVDLEKAVEVDLVSDEEAEEVIVWGKPERKSVETAETVETVETDEDVMLKEKYRILANNDVQVSSSAVSDLTIQTTPKAENRVVQEVDELPYKTLYASGQGRDRKLTHLSFDIGLLTKKLSGFWRSAKKKPEKDLRGETLTPLTDEEETEVSRALANSNRRKLLAAHSDSNIEITGQVLQCLRPGAWLNDEVINLYLELLKEREKREPQKFLKCHFFNTFFYKKLISGKGGYDFKAVRRWTTQRKIGYGLIECDKIFVPIHKEIHWCLAIINKKDQKFQYLDSLKGRDSKVLQVLAKYYADEVKDKSEIDIDVDSWKLEYVTDLPAQENGFDCGMFMIKYADFYSRGLGLCFGQENMPYFRRRTAKEILRLRAE